VRGRSGGVGAEAVAGVGEERALMSNGEVLWLEAEAREVATTRHRSGTKTRSGGGRNFDRRRWQRHPFKGAAGTRAVGGGSGYSSTAVATAGTTTTGAGGCRRRGTGEGERDGGRQGGWRVARLEGGGPSLREREGKVREVDRWGRLQCRWFR
jgi:hypothetical protein